MLKNEALFSILYTSNFQAVISVLNELYSFFSLTNLATANVSFVPIGLLGLFLQVLLHFSIL